MVPSAMEKFPMTLRIASFLLAIALLTPWHSLAAAEADIGFVGGLRFSTTTLFVGDTVRIYARIRNGSETDMTGLIGFYLGDNPLGNSQPFSAPKGGFDEEIFVDFLVPSGTFNVMARVDSSTPQDTNTANNYVQTLPQIPVPDDDRDGVRNEADNCPSAKNADQVDTDGDKIGDACDRDDDNDGLSDEVETTELGSDPLKKDTDGDAIEDAKDQNPIVFDHPPVPVPRSISYPKEVENPANGVTQGLKKWFATKSEISATSSEPTASVLSAADTAPLTISPRAIFDLQQQSWNTYFLRARTSDIHPVQVLWNFGDGDTSTEAEAIHRFPGAGTYVVTLMVTDQNGMVDEDRVSVVISFFHLANPVFLSLLTVLSIVLLLSAAAFWRLPRSVSHEV